jgi:hypothetical protein
VFIGTENVWNMLKESACVALSAFKMAVKEEYQRLLVSAHLALTEIPILATKERWCHLLSIG